MSWPWSQLGLSGPASLSEVRHAYAEKLKTTHPEEDPEGFQRLHSAYQLASRLARQQQRQARPAPPPERPPQRELHLKEQERLLRGEQETSTPPARTGEEKEQDFDFDELLQEESSQPQLFQEEDEEEQEFDFDELLQGDETPPRPKREDEEEQDFDFDELLQEDEAPPHPKREDDEGQDFDFERLLAEGEAERAEERRRRAEARRRAQAQAKAWARERQKAQEWSQKREQWQRQEEQKEQRNSYEQERRERFDQEQLQWQNTETILHTIEMLYNARADRQAWEKFLQSPLFQQTKDSLDLIFGLEDFVSAHQDLPQPVKLALFLAYGFDQGVSRPDLRPLYQMLLPAWQTEQGEKRKKKTGLFWSYIGGIALVPISILILTSDWLLGFLLLGVVFFFGLKKGWFRRKPEALSPKKRWLGLLWLLASGSVTFLCIRLGLGLKLPLCVLAVGLACFVLQEIIRTGRQEAKAGGKPANRQDDWLLAAMTAALLVLGMFMLFKPELKEVVSRIKDPREQVCQYLEEDYGEGFRSLYHEPTVDSAGGRYDNVFAPKDRPDKLFLAGPDGERDAKNGKLGYTTNYPDMMVLWKLQDFAEEHGLHELETMNRNQNLKSWETCGVYLIVLPFYGAGEVITDLGETLEELAGEDWYQFQTPVFQVVLCSEQLAEGRLILQEYQSASGDFDAQGLRELYEESFAHAYCDQIIQECELDRDFTHSNSTEIYILTNEGMAQIKGTNCCKLYGLDESGQVAMEYYVDVDSNKVCNIYCFPGGFWETGGNEDDLHFYRLVHREEGLGLVYLHYPWLTQY